MCDINDLSTFFGRFFASSNSYRSPDVYRVIGHTAKQVIVKRVTMKSTYDAIHNGSHQIDASRLDELPNEPHRKTPGGWGAIRAKPGLVDETKSDSDAYIIVKGEYHFEASIKESWTSCEY